MSVEKLPPDVLRIHKGVSFPGITTSFVCYDGSGQIFLARRTEKARDEHGAWEPGAGGLKFGQTIEENMRRELKEEFGATPLRTTFLGYFDMFRSLPDETPTHWVSMAFAVKVEREDMKICEPEMFDASGWFSLDALPEPMFSQFHKYKELFGSHLTKLIHS